MLNAARNFLLDAAPATCVPMGNGHINRTCLLTDEAGNKYTMQKINDSIFKDVPALMENIRLVTEYLRACDPDPRHSLQLVHTKDGKCFHHDETGYYRVYRFVDESVCLERAETQEEFFLSAQAFGSFQNQLAGFDAAVLSETIPRFHDTANRVNNLKIAAANDKMGRLKEVQAEYEFALAREEEAGVMLKLLKEGKLKLRVTHNDTKLNNVLFDEKTPVEWAMDFLWNREEVSLLLSGMGTMEQVQSNIDYADKAEVGMLTEENLDMLAKTKEVFDKMALVPCTKCAYCMPCPFGLDIPKTFEAYNATASLGTDRAKAIYAELNKGADQCKKCKKCEKVCPQSIKISHTMTEIAKIFAK